MHWTTGAEGAHGSVCRHCALHQRLHCAAAVVDVLSVPKEVAARGGAAGAAPPQVHMKLPAAHQPNLEHLERGQRTF